MEYVKIKNNYYTEDSFYSDIITSLSKEIRAKNVNKVIIIFASLFFIFSSFVVLKFFNDNIFNIKKVSIKSAKILKSSDAKFLNVNESYRLLTYAFKIEKSDIINLDNWQNFYETIPIELKQFNLKNKTYFIFGFLNETEVNNFFKMLKKNNMVKANCCKLVKPIINL